MAKWWVAHRSWPDVARAAYSLLVTAELTVRIRVKPGASRTRVLGAFGGTCDEQPALVVAVCAPPVDGRANAAVVEALADALRLRRHQVTVVSGLTSRTKTVRLTVADEDIDRIQATVADLLNP